MQKASCAPYGENCLTIARPELVEGGSSTVETAGQRCSDAMRGRGRGHSPARIGPKSRHCPESARWPQYAAARIDLRPSGSPGVEIQGEPRGRSAGARPSVYFGTASQVLQNGRTLRPRPFAPSSPAHKRFGLEQPPGSSCRGRRKAFASRMRGPRQPLRRSSREERTTTQYGYLYLVRRQ